SPPRGEGRKAVGVALSASAGYSCNTKVQLRPRSPGWIKPMSRVFSSGFVLLGLLTGPPAAAEVALVGKASVPGTATDLSGLKDVLSDGTPHNRLGAMGSGLDYTGSGNRYVMIADRGPKDGATYFFCRMHLFEIRVAPGRSPSLTVALEATTLLTDE